jgi:hypothetical protein|tara:strand:- start:4 stop:162 length:159 start_codon:yes stop_codon:yes gene_type:complete
MICPKCGIENEDNWPLDIDDKILDGGCQECWEAECADSFWDVMDITIALLLR